MGAERRERSRWTRRLLGLGLLLGASAVLGTERRGHEQKPCKPSFDYEDRWAVHLDNAAARFARALPLGAAAAICIGIAGLEKSPKIYAVLLYPGAAVFACWAIGQILLSLQACIKSALVFDRGRPGTAFAVASVLTLIWLCALVVLIVAMLQAERTFLDTLNSAGRTMP
ncbi:hypothetical protein [Jannaschia rubra]|uniref:hypothetical protein n=1 Tax=Jannaschia rubra TaxID=282197 RepID=UPI00249181FB|nr:hypothetical protein [Jannaschia rubra]